ncbi:hypothetical protein HNR02_000675 [Amycolatopsis endophytica]|uniref:Uncharacterized protein n=1 Tax=Amycolatopsis endophytica TaxID=860233 RepID=A0A853AXG1_9PSEU|nr:hypothetical protein [Amycolatopsis endophytica]
MFLGVGQGRPHRGGELLDHLRVLLDVGLRAEIHPDLQVRVGARVVGRHLAIALPGRDGQERLHDLARVDVALGHRGGDVRERQLHVLDPRRVTAGLPDDLVDRGGVDVLQRVDRDLLAREVRRGPDRAVGFDDDGTEVLALHAGGGVAGADDLHRQALGLGQQQRRRVAEAELELPAHHAGHDRRTTLRSLQCQVEVLLLEEPLADSEVDGRHVDDRDDTDLERRVALGVGGRRAATAAAGCRGHGQRERGRRGDHASREWAAAEEPVHMVTQVTAIVNNCEANHDHKNPQDPRRSLRKTPRHPTGCSDK